MANSRWLESLLSIERREKLQAKNIYIYYHTFTRDVFCETVKINWIKTFTCSAILMKIGTFWTNTLRFRSSVKTHMMTSECWAGICSEKKKQTNKCISIRKLLKILLILKTKFMLHSFKNAWNITLAVCRYV